MAIGSAAEKRTWVYTGRRPEKTLLYRVVQQNWKSFEAQVERRGTSLPKYLTEEFESYLKCGIHAHGFARFQCEGCRSEKLVAFSCKKRGFCPSCGQRRMSETAADLCDNVFPRVPIRQWVLSLPVPARYWMSKNPKLITDVLTVINRVIHGYYKKKARIAGPMTGAITFIQRFGGSLNLNIHFHILYIDGAFELQNDKLEFHPVPEPTEDEILTTVTRVASRLNRLFMRKGLMDEDDTELSVDEQIMGASVRSLSLIEGQRALGKEKLLEPNLSAKSRLCVPHLGYSLHAAVHVGTHERSRLESLIRYVARSSLPLSRMRETQNGRIELKLKKPWNDGTTAIYFTPMQLIERLVALVPKPRAHLTRFHGVLAPHSKLRSQVVPQRPTAKMDKLKTCPTRRSGWAKLLARVFDIHMEKCVCGKTVKFIATVEDPKVIKKILTHVGLPTQAPTFMPARAPPQAELF